ncbi:MAG: L,D-transpeptidase family protein [Elusimicrobia bacterium]|nr:L,D-transpeptidase family protein [Elusimicrobiota bacterium]
MTARNLLAGLACAAAVSASAAKSFKETQLEFPRVRAAAESKAKGLEKLFSDKKLQWPPSGLFLRAFKSEGRLELWAEPKAGGKLVLAKEYPICASSGELGPKRREGDGQVPEGAYRIVGFNPKSNFHLSLEVDYPNASDRVRSDKKRPGGDIFIHGNCVTIGCIPIQDEGIKELYWAAVEARSAGQGPIPVHIFPARLTDAALAKLGRTASRHLGFWRELKPLFDRFEKDRRVPEVRVAADGRYRLSE